MLTALRSARWVTGGRNHQLAGAFLSRSSRLRSKVANLANISDYFDWQHSNFRSIPYMRSKKLLWREVSKEMQAEHGPWHGFEFGVAAGEATRWWLESHEPDVIATWDGYDRFTGLPKEWRHLAEGTFDIGGEPPPIEDPRIEWHVGDVADTIDATDPDRLENGQRLFYFDFDLYEPSKVAWDWVAPRLRPGDVLYFDEAFDADERRLLDEEVLPHGVFQAIGATDLNLAMRVVSLRVAAPHRASQ